jgi:pyridoxamine 5'-phosphate oxidase family protein
MTAFSEAELGYLRGGSHHLARIGTVGYDGVPHVVPAGWVYNGEFDTIDVTGHSVERTKKFRGRAEAIREPRALIRIHPDRVVSWGL